MSGIVLCSLTLCLLPKDGVPAVQDAPLMGKFKLKGKGEKHKLKAAKQQISVEPSNLMNGEEGQSRVLLSFRAPLELHAPFLQTIYSKAVLVRTSNRFTKKK